MSTTNPSIPRRPGIYQIRNLIDGKVYIGSAKSISHRWKHHRSDLALSRHHSRFLQRAWDKHGSGSFLFEVLEIVEDHADLVAREQFHIDATKASDLKYGYNLQPKAGSRLGAVVSGEGRARISKSLVGRSLTAEHRANISAGGKGMKKPPRSTEHRANLSASQRGKPKPRRHRIGKGQLSMTFTG